MKRRAVAEANTNIALVKYWGKRDARLNLPAVGSLSLTLEGLTTRTEVRFEGALEADGLILNGEPIDGEPQRRISKFLDLVRERAGLKERAVVSSANNFPTAAGLASSASAFAALALAATRAAGLDLPARELSVLARRGSGSAARSIFGGFVHLHRGVSPDGDDCHAEPVEGAEAWGVRLVVGVTSDAKKATLSTDGMRHTAETSPYYAQWVATSEPDLADARRAIAARDLELLGVVTERSCLTMHASAMAARPAVVYFSGATIDGYRAVQAMRKDGIPAWFTCDAGPHVKALTDAAHADEVARRLALVPGVLRTNVCAPGKAARVVEMIGNVLAPGKAILCGEYAVLHGAPAVSVAVDRCVRAWIRPGQGTALSPFLTAALEHTAAALHRPELMQSGHLGVDSKALYEGDQKLGLGSSAAVTVAAVGAALVESGEPLHDKRRIFDLADEAHAAAQGTRGSGIDVATSVWGGALRFERKNGKPVITPTDLPDDVFLTFVFTGTAASTPLFIGKVKALAESQPAVHESAIGRLISLSHAFCAAFADREAEALIRAAGAYGDAMKQLGESAGADIVTDAHQRIAQIARHHGGAAKPSGAGGGDLGVAFTRGPTATGALRADLLSAGLAPLALGAPAPGLRMETT